MNFISAVALRASGYTYQYILFGQTVNLAHHLPSTSIAVTTIHASMPHFRTLLVTKSWRQSAHRIDPLPARQTCVVSNPVLEEIYRNTCSQSEHAAQVNRNRIPDERDPEARHYSGMTINNAAVPTNVHRPQHRCLEEDTLVKLGRSTKNGLASSGPCHRIAAIIRYRARPNTNHA